VHPTPTHWGLTVSEWITVAAIVLGPILAVATQLWFQARKTKRDSKLWVFNTLMGLRASIVSPNFVQAFNLVDSVFYRNSEVRDKRREFFAVISDVKGREMNAQEIEKCNDLIAEMLAKMGKELGFDFDHTQIKNTGWYPIGFQRTEEASIALREKALAVLEGKASIGVVIKDEPAPRLNLPLPR
jgi:hypothetical protein